MRKAAAPRDVEHLLDPAQCSAEVSVQHVELRGKLEPLDVETGMQRGVDLGPQCAELLFRLQKLTCFEQRARSRDPHRHGMAPGEIWHRGPRVLDPAPDCGPRWSVLAR